MSGCAGHTIHRHQSHCGWNNANPPVLTIAPGESVEFEVFEASGGQLSPDGRWVSFVKPLDGIRNVWVKSIDEPFEAARPMTADSLRPVQGYFWSQDSKVILFVQDQGGNENFHVYAVDPRAAPEAAALWPGAKVNVLRGGNGAWRAAGGAGESGIERATTTLDDVWYKPYDHGANAEKHARDYLEWEVALVEQIKRDPAIRFRAF